MSSNRTPPLYESSLAKYFGDEISYTKDETFGTEMASETKVSYTKFLISYTNFGPRRWRGLKRGAKSPESQLSSVLVTVLDEIVFDIPRLHFADFVDLLIVFRRNLVASCES